MPASSALLDRVVVGRHKLARGKKPLFARAARLGGLFDRGGILRPGRPRRRRPKANVLEAAGAYALDAIFSFSYKPLRLSLVLGLTTALFAPVLRLLPAVYAPCRLADYGPAGMGLYEHHRQRLIHGRGAVKLSLDCWASTLAASTSGRSSAPCSWCSKPIDPTCRRGQRWRQAWPWKRPVRLR